MKTVLKLFKIFVEKKTFLFFITTLMIIFSTIFTIIQAEAGQAFLSIINKTAFIKTIEKQNQNENFVDFIKNLLSSKSIEEAVQKIVESRNLNYLILSSFLIILAFLLYEVFFYLQNTFCGILGLEVSIDYLKQTFDKLLNLPSLYYRSKGTTGDILSRLTNDINNIRIYSVYILLTLFSTPILFIFSLYMLFKKSMKFTLILILFGIIAFIIINLITKILKHFVSINMQKAAITTDYINKTIYGIDIIKIFNKNKFQKDSFKKELKDYKNSFIRRFLLEFSIRPLTELIGSVILIFVLLASAYLIFNNKMSIDKLFGFIIYLVILSPKANELSGLLSNLRVLEASLDRIEEILNLDEEAIHFGKNDLINFEGNIEFKNVYFSYTILNLKKIEIEQTQHHLENVSFKINKNEYVAIVGPSGSGKSTIVNLICALIYPNKGKILFDEKDYQNFSLDSIRKHISYVTQETILFPDTIYNNIAFGTENTNLEEVIYFAKIAYAHNFIENLPDGYNTIIGERGAKLSGGEKQRIAIARALIKKPKILIFDEATSNLDSESENYINKAMENISKLQTTIVIAHRLSTILKADKIIVLNNGKIIDIGKHDELILRCDLYKNLYSLQFNNSNN
jgi:subfamily B ATP-binding cassette protein MsbA